MPVWPMWTRVARVDCLTPPLRQRADVGIAMNAGSDAAKDASAIVLLNNDFSSTVSAVCEGRLIFINLRKVRHDAHPRGLDTPTLLV